MRLRVYIFVMMHSAEGGIALTRERGKTEAGDPSSRVLWAALLNVDARDGAGIVRRGHFEIRHVFRSDARTMDRT